MLMSADLFLDCILYIINDNTERSRNLVRELIALFETDARTNTAIDDDVTRFYIRVLRMLMDAGVTKNSPDELRIILLKFQSDAVLAKKKEIYDLLYATFLSPDQLPVDKLDQLAGRIHNTLLWHMCNKVTRTQYATLSRAADMINPLDQGAELRKILAAARDIDTAFTRSSTEGSSQQRSLVERIDMSDKDSMKSALKKFQERSVTGILRLGLQGLNRMCGKRGGLARGESLVVYALPHNYKSGLLMSIPIWVPLYNTPAPTGGKKPLVLLISLENEAFQNFVWMFRHHYETSTQSSSENLTDDEVSSWAYEAFATKGYTLIIERHAPYQFNFQTYLAIVEYYENSGYEIVLTSIDYLNLMEKDGTGTRTEGGNHLAVRAIYSVMCNYNKNKGITFTTAHPLNRKASEVASSGQTNAVKRFDSSHIADSFDVAREVDFEWYCHIERNIDGVAYLTLRRGKHRYVDDTPMSHQYCAYRFHAKFGIRDDLRLFPEFVQDIYDDPLVPDAERGVPTQPAEQALEVALF